MDTTNENELSLADIVKALKEAVESETTREQVAQLKSNFYKRQAALLEQLKKDWVAEGKELSEFAHTFAEEAEFKEILQAYKNKRAEELKQIEVLQERAYDIKKGIVERISELVNGSDDVDKIFAEVRKLQNDWKNAGEVAQSKYNEIVKRYQTLMTQFYDDVRISNELRDYDFKKNLEAKTALCEAAEALVSACEKSSGKLNEAFQKLQKLHSEWRELGPVAKEYREDLWNRFKAASDTINHSHAEFFQAKKVEEEANLAAKTALCEAVEAIDYAKASSYKAWEEIAEKVISLQEEWKKTGFAPKKANTKIYERFRKACDAIFKAKSEFYKSTKETLASNLERKKALCDAAEALKESKEWKEATDKFVQMQKEWKQIGPVSKRASEQVWNRFKTACDYFFEQKKSATEGTFSFVKEREKLVRAYDKIVSDITTRENNMEFLNFDSKKKNPLMKQMQDSIDKLKKERDELKIKIKQLEKKIRDGEQ
ncbi:MAG: DUF349 domain-containing protein [Paludibacteraceae bacterium]|nr:DUF349 domain-containing protein [Paludibacteraceae bacterium]